MIIKGDVAYIEAEDAKQKLLVIPEEVVEICRKESLEKCLIKEVVLPKSVERIGDKTFACVRELKKINLDTVKFFGTKAFERTMIEEAMLTSAVEVGSYAFSRCSSLQIVIFGASVERIGQSAFDHTSIELLNTQTATVIESHAFHGCNLMKNVILPKVRVIEDYAFALCTMERATMNNIKDIGVFAFCDCRMLNVVDMTFATDIVVREQAFKNTDSLMHIVGSEGISFLLGEAFANSNLPHITLRKDTVADKAAFAGSKIKSIKLEEITPHCVYWDVRQYHTYTVTCDHILEDFICFDMKAHKIIGEYSLKNGYVLYVTEGKNEKRYYFLQKDGKFLSVGDARDLPNFNKIVEGG